MKIKKAFSFILLPAFMFALTLVASTSSGQADGMIEHTRVTIISTTDLHGNILPIDYYTNKPDERGLAKVATLIRAARKENPALLLIDSGDTIQGAPLEYVHNKKNNTPPDPMMLAMNALKYDSMTVGNHEYNFGLKVFEKARGEAKFPWLSANTYRKGTDQTAFTPYIIKDVGGARVGVLGLTTPGIPGWENTENYAGLEFREPVSEAEKWVKILRQKERVDLVVIAMHMGLERDLRTGEVNPGQQPNENAAIAIAERVQGIDVILMGHTHREVPSLYIDKQYVNGVLLTQADYWGHCLARVDIYLKKDNRVEGLPRWEVTSKAARTIPVTDKVEADAEIAKIAEPYDKETQEWLSRVIGESDADLTAVDARFRDTAILDLVQRVQLEAGKADVSMVASFNDRARINKGAVTVRDIAGLYVYENTLVVIEVNGQQLKDALEHSARYFRAYEPGKTAADLVDEKIPGYNFDIAEGVTYDLDISKPFGQRIQNLRYHGQPLDPKQKLRLAINNYRANGGGRYTMYKDAPVVYRSSQEIRDMVIDWVERNKRIPTEPSNNWRLLP
ncbi:MAG TPA: bifunctional UDP-sugar hydrolase/5'-nucleotidase [Pyrinomonadaceae bacterium]